jgi:hypothetical protein
VNEVELTYICAFVGFLREIVISVHGYEQDKTLSICIQPKLPFVIKYTHYIRTQLIQIFRNITPIFL